MVLPDGTSVAPKQQTRARRGLFVAGTFALAVGALGFGALTMPDPPSTAAEVSTTTTTTTPLGRPIDFENFSISQIATGPPLDWKLVGDHSDLYAQELISNRGWLYVFAGSASPWGPGPQNGMWGWRSRDGVAWEAMGQLIAEEHQVGRVAATDQGLIALEPGRAGSGFGLWRSSDGFEWDREEVPVDHENRLGIAYPRAVASADRLLVVAGDIQIDSTAILNELLAERLGPGIDVYRFGWSTEITADDVEFVIMGPLGIPIARASAREMGLSKKERRAIADGHGGSQQANTWVSWDADGVWEQGELAQISWVETLASMPDGSIHAYGFGSSGHSAWETFEGLFWEPVSSGAQPWQVELWEDRLVGSASNQTDLLISSDGAQWASTGLGALFPNQLGWNVSMIGAGPRGIAAVVEGWSGASRPLRNQEPIALEDGGIELVLDFSRGVIEMSDGFESRTWRMWESARFDGIEADLATETVTFTLDDAGDITARFTFDQLNRAEHEFWGGNLFADRHRALAFSSDGESWAIHDLNEAVGDDTMIAGLEITDSRIVALLSFEPSFGSEPGFEIWSATLP